jgi:LSD1 subclass zinc finger protein
MRLEELTCNSCGAPLEVPESANFVKCNHCLKQLAVRRTDDVTFTETIDRLAEQSELFSNRIADLELQRQLDELEREWQKAREPLLGSRTGSIPTIRDATIIAAIGIVFAIGSWIMISPLEGKPNTFASSVWQMKWIASLIFLLTCLPLAKSEYSKVVRYEELAYRFEDRRSRLRCQYEESETAAQVEDEQNHDSADP